MPKNCIGKHSFDRNFCLKRLTLVPNSSSTPFFKSLTVFLRFPNDFCWFCEVLRTEMRSFFGSPSVHQKNSSFLCLALHLTSKSHWKSQKDCFAFEKSRFTFLVTKATFLAQFPSKIAIHRHNIVLSFFADPRCSRDIG